MTNNRPLFRKVNRRLKSVAFFEVQYFFNMVCELSEAPSMDIYIKKIIIIIYITLRTLNKMCSTKCSDWERSSSIIYKGVWHCDGNMWHRQSLETIKTWYVWPKTERNSERLPSSHARNFGVSGAGVSEAGVGPHVTWPRFQGLDSLRQELHVRDAITWVEKGPKVTWGGATRRTMRAASHTFSEETEAFIVSDCDW